MHKPQGFTLVEIAVVVAITAMIGLAIYMYSAKLQTRPADQTTTDTTSPYQSNADLDIASASLESSDIDTQLDASLQQLDQESSTF